MAHNKAREQQRKGKNGMSDIFLGAWPLASPRILGACPLTIRQFRGCEHGGFVENFRVSKET